ncbi:MAG TPA: toxin TcdB middle/N-terminal domain-containing protein, partial [Polyangiaceae bacterium]|nr:toxin TcdB middle/N-terminal domain-containing protein [Polyangiaceae bacterium]
MRNGIGKTLELEYASSTDLMLDAAAAGRPWARAMPMAVPVVVRSRVKDNLEKVGRTAGNYVTEYGYRDPLFEGRQREFRGFEIAETRQIGDPGLTSSQRSTFLLGECKGSGAACSPANRWRDNPREALKGLPAVIETFDEQGTYLSTVHRAYELRQLYVGRDGRGVNAALPVTQDTYLYNTAAFTAQPTQVDFAEVTATPPSLSPTENRSLTRQATTGTSRVRKRTVFDNFGNLTDEFSDGCVEACASTDETVTAHSDYGRPASDLTGWLWRTTRTFVTGSVHTGNVRDTTYNYNAQGDLTSATAQLSGTLPLVRSHAVSGKSVAAAPPNASGGTSSAVTITLATYTRDAFGNATTVKHPVARCTNVSFDLDYAELPISETTFVGGVGSNGCGTRALTTGAVYDRGFKTVTDVTDMTGQPARYAYDGFARLSSETFANPASPGTLAAVPKLIFEYSLTADGNAQPFSLVRVRNQDGSNPNVASYRDIWAYIDGLGRKIAVLSQTDPAEGGDFTLGDLAQYDAKGAVVRSYDLSFWSGAPSTLALNLFPAGAGFKRQDYDAFGRNTFSYAQDGAAKVRRVYHALSADNYDAGDLNDPARRDTFVTTTSDGHGRLRSRVDRIHVGSSIESRSTIYELLPTGEAERVVLRRAGSTDVVHWAKYDTLGRMVLNVEPNTSTGFNPSPATN